MRIHGNRVSFLIDRMRGKGVVRLASVEVEGGISGRVSLRKGGFRGGFFCVFLIILSVVSGLSL